MLLLLQIVGGSFISTGQLASKYARYQFRPHFFQHATFRLVQSCPDMQQYSMDAVTPERPILPFFETSCMDAAEPYVGDSPCCSTSRHDRCGSKPDLEPWYRYSSPRSHTYVASCFNKLVLHLLFAWLSTLWCACRPEYRRSDTAPLI